MEHFDGMKLAHSEFVVAGSDSLDRLLASYGADVELMEDNDFDLSLDATWARAATGTRVVSADNERSQLCR